MRTLRKVHSSQFPFPSSHFPFPISQFPVHSTPLKHSQSAAAKELARLSNASKFGFFFCFLPEQFLLLYRLRLCSQIGVEFVCMSGQSNEKASLRVVARQLVMLNRNRTTCFFVFKYQGGLHLAAPPPLGGSPSLVR